MAGTMKSNEWALVTGASAGIGLELARLFAARGFSQVLVARNEARLQQLAAELKTRHPGTDARVLAADLARPGAAEAIFKATAGVPVSVLVNNAGFGHYGRFTGSPLKPQADLMQVNMTALVELTHYFARPMVERRAGRILNVASVAAFVPGPTVSLYYASKAFVHSFSYALAVELEPCGVTVTCLCPGSTRTEFFARAGISTRKPYPMMSAQAVAEAGFRGLMRGRRVVVPGWSNRVMAAFLKRLPPAWPSRAVQRIHRPR